MESVVDVVVEDADEDDVLVVVEEVDVLVVVASTRLWRLLLLPLPNRFWNWNVGETGEAEGDKKTEEDDNALLLLLLVVVGVGWTMMGDVGDKGGSTHGVSTIDGGRGGGGGGAGEKKSQTFWPGLSLLVMMWVKDRTSLVDWRGSNGGFLSRNVCCGGLEGEGSGEVEDAMTDNVLNAKCVCEENRER